MNNIRAVILNREKPQVPPPGIYGNTSYGEEGEGAGG